MPARHAMAHADAAWLRMDRPTNLMVVNSVLWLEGRPDWDAIRARFGERLVGRFPRFAQRGVSGGLLGGAAWEDVPGFDPETHFHHLALPAPHDRAALQRLVGDLASQPLDHDRPLWEAYLIDDFGSGAAILTRIHHAVADGIALARVMLSLTDGGDPAVADLTSRDGGWRGSVTGLAGSVLQASVATVREPRRIAGAVAQGRRDIGSLAKLLLPTRERSGALRSPPRVAHRFAWTAPYDLWRVRVTGRALDATVNDILVAAVAGALRAHVAAQGEAPEDVHALVPFNLRPLDQPVPRTLGNRFGLVLLALPLEAEDPLDRLWLVKQRMRSIKRSDEGAIAFGILDAMGRTPAPVERVLIDYFTAKGSLVLTNVPGPRRRVSLAGVPVGGVLVWAPCSGSVEMSVSVFSYGGKVTVGFLVDAGLVPEPQPLADAVRAELLGYARLARAVAPRPQPR